MDGKEPEKVVCSGELVKEDDLEVTKWTLLVPGGGNDRVHLSGDLGKKEIIDLYFYHVGLFRLDNYRQAAIPGALQITCSKSDNFTELQCKIEDTLEASRPITIKKPIHKSLEIEANTVKFTANLTFQNIKQNRKTKSEEMKRELNTEMIPKFFHAYDT
ncbi:hypothetical protein L2E82_38343 [Cichorium intybus]|uniref:Uncharacterized protein n=1 Tax=Cichorium intybus TaxID=13427 RepID=A0ACB9AFC1_CICIN|nr:hypothetical protein L2E82_38343 [Cichorium intybus]